MTTETAALQTTQTEPTARFDPAEDAEAVAAAEQAEQDAAGEHLAAFGCRDADRVFLAAVPGQRRQSYALTIPQCPGCGKSHEITAMPRPRKLSDEIAVSVEAPPERTRRCGGSHSSPAKSDADVLAAIPDDWTSATEVAEALGYGNRGSFINRVAEMRKRGVAIEARRKHRGAPMFIRRAE